MIRVDKRFIIVTVFFLCFSLLLGGSLPFFIFYTMLFMLLASYLYIRTLHSAFNVEITCCKNILSTGDSSNVLTKIKFDITLPVPYVEIQCDAFSKGDSGYSGFLRGTTWDENIWIEDNVRFCQRGEHSLCSVYVKVSDLFHITSFEENISTGIKIKVYPRIYKIKPLVLSGIDIYREAADLKSRSEDQHTVRDVRKYREGDSIKKIHWKLSAKQDNLYVKNLDTISGEEIVLFVDMNQKNYSFDTDGTVEENIINFSASVINQMITRNLSIKVFLNTSPGRYFELSDRADFNKLMDFLMSEKSDGTRDLFQYIYENSLRLHRMNKIAIVVSELDDCLVEALMRMSSSGYSISVFYCVKKMQQDYSSSLRKTQIECCYFSDYIEP